MGQIINLRLTAPITQKRLDLTVYKAASAYSCQTLAPIAVDKISVDK